MSLREIPPCKVRAHAIDSFWVVTLFALFSLIDPSYSPLEEEGVVAVLSVEIFT